jgi:hypothetical protein
MLIPNSQKKTEFTTVFYPGRKDNEGNFIINPGAFFFGGYTPERGRRREMEYLDMRKNIFKSVSIKFISNLQVDLASGFQLQKTEGAEPSIRSAHTSVLWEDKIYVYTKSYH